MACLSSESCVLILCILATCYVGVWGQLPPEDMERIDAFVEEILQCSGIPGMALAAVKENEVVIAKGYGKANLEQGIDVDENTRFNIASITKAFTGALIARMLSASESYTWNTPAREIIGDWFHLFNGYYSNHTTLRDLLSMKTGVPRNDLPWLLDIFDRTEQAERIRFLNPVIPFRADYLYNNEMYVVAGVVAGEMGGATWEDLVTDLLFEPIGMSSSTFIDRAPGDYEGYATPYLPTSSGGPLVPVHVGAYQGFRSAGPTGSIASSALDMSKWVLFWLNDATTEDGTALLTPQELADFLAPEISVNSAKPDLPVLFLLREKYAKGFYRGFYKDYEILQHTGTMPGYYSLLHLLPDRGAGSFLSFNAPEYGIRDYVLAHVNDILLEEEPWITAEEICTLIPQLKEEYLSADNPDQFFLFTKDKIMSHNPILNDPRPVQLLEEYTGVYGNFGYGNASVSLNTDTESLEMEFGNIGLFDLLPTADEDVFVAQGKEGASTVYNVGQIVFSRSEGDVVDILDMPDAQPDAPPRFIQDLLLADAPPADIESCN